MTRRAYVLSRRPRVGAVIATKYGPAVVTSVGRHGRRLTVRTDAHGTELVDRAERGWWTVLAPAPAPFVLHDCADCSGARSAH